MASGLQTFIEHLPEVKDLSRDSFVASTFTEPSAIADFEYFLQLNLSKAEKHFTLTLLAKSKTSAENEVLQTFSANFATPPTESFSSEAQIEDETLDLFRTRASTFVGFQILLSDLKALTTPERAMAEPRGRRGSVSAPGSAADPASLVPAATTGPAVPTDDLLVRLARNKAGRGGKGGGGGALARAGGSSLRALETVAAAAPAPAPVVLPRPGSQSLMRAGDTSARSLLPAGGLTSASVAAAAARGNGALREVLAEPSAVARRPSFFPVLDLSALADAVTSLFASASTPDAAPGHELAAHPAPETARHTALRSASGSRPASAQSIPGGGAASGALRYTSSSARMRTDWDDAIEALGNNIVHGVTSAMINAALKEFEERVFSEMLSLERLSSEKMQGDLNEVFKSIEAEGLGSEYAETFKRLYGRLIETYFPRERQLRSFKGAFAQLPGSAVTRRMPGGGGGAAASFVPDVTIAIDDDAAAAPMPGRRDSALAELAPHIVRASTLSRGGSVSEGDGVLPPSPPIHITEGDDDAPPAETIDAYIEAVERIIAFFTRHQSNITSNRDFIAAIFAKIALGQVITFAAYNAVATAQGDLQALSRRIAEFDETLHEEIDSIERGLRGLGVSETDIHTHMERIAAARTAVLGLIENVGEIDAAIKAIQDYCTWDAVIESLRTSTAENYPLHLERLQNLIHFNFPENSYGRMAEDLLSLNAILHLAAHLDGIASALYEKHALRGVAVSTVSTTARLPSRRARRDASLGSPAGTGIMPIPEATAAPMAAPLPPIEDIDGISPELKDVLLALNSPLSAEDNGRVEALAAGYLAAPGAPYQQAILRRLLQYLLFIPPSSNPESLAHKQTLLTHIRNMARAHRNALQAMGFIHQVIDGEAVKYEACPNMRALFNELTFSLERLSISLLDRRNNAEDLSALIRALQEKIRTNHASVQEHISYYDLAENFATTLANLSPRRNLTKAEIIDIKHQIDDVCFLLFLKEKNITEWPFYPFPPERRTAGHMSWIEALGRGLRLDGTQMSHLLTQMTELNAETRARIQGDIMTVLSFVPPSGDIGADDGYGRRQTYLSIKMALTTKDLDRVVNAESTLYRDKPTMQNISRILFSNVNNAENPNNFIVANMMIRRMYQPFVARAWIDPEMDRQLISVLGDKASSIRFELGAPYEELFDTRDGAGALAATDFKALTGLLRAQAFVGAYHYQLKASWHLIWQRAFWTPEYWGWNTLRHPVDYGYGTTKRHDALNSPVGDFLLNNDARITAQLADLCGDGGRELRFEGLSPTAAAPGSASLPMALSDEATVTTPLVAFGRARRESIIGRRRSVEPEELARQTAFTDTYMRLLHLINHIFKVSRHLEGGDRDQMLKAFYGFINSFISTGIDTDYIAGIKSKVAVYLQLSKDTGATVIDTHLKAIMLSIHRFLVNQPLSDLIAKIEPDDFKALTKSRNRKALYIQLTEGTASALALVIAVGVGVRYSTKQAAEIIPFNIDAVFSDGFVRITDNVAGFYAGDVISMNNGIFVAPLPTGLIFQNAGQTAIVVQGGYHFDLLNLPMQFDNTGRGVLNLEANIQVTRANGDTGFHSIGYSIDTSFTYQTIGDQVVFFHSGGFIAGTEFICNNGNPGVDINHLPAGFFWNATTNILSVTEAISGNSVVLPASTTGGAFFGASAQWPWLENSFPFSQDGLSHAFLPETPTFNLTRSLRGWHPDPVELDFYRGALLPPPFALRPALGAPGASSLTWNGTATAGMAGLMLTFICVLLAYAARRCRHSEAEASVFWRRGAAAPREPTAEPKR